MHPVLFYLFGFPVHTYGVLLWVGIMASALWVQREFRRRQLPLELWSDVLLFGVPLAIVSARLVYVVLAWHEFAGKPLSILKLWEGGLSFHGALIGMVAAAWLGARRHGKSFWVVADAFAPAVFLGIAIGRIGCFFNGCCYGTPTDLPCGVQFYDAKHDKFTARVHPAQLYESALALLLFALLLKLRHRAKVAGQVTLLFFMLYAVERFFIEFFRVGATAEVLALGLTQAQWVSLLVLPVLFLLHRRLTRKEAVHEAETPRPRQKLLTLLRRARHINR